MRVLPKPTVQGRKLPCSSAPREMRRAGKALSPALLKGPGSQASTSCIARPAAVRPKCSPFPGLRKHSKLPQKSHRPPTRVISDVRHDGSWGTMSEPTQLFLSCSLLSTCCSQNRENHIASDNPADASPQSNLAHPRVPASSWDSLWEAQPPTPATCQSACRGAWSC